MDTYQQGERVLPRENPWQGASIGSDTLIAGEFLHPGLRLESRSLKFAALMRRDGDFVVYRSNDWLQLWHSGTCGDPGAFLAVRDDGDLTVCTANGVQGWSSGTAGSPGAFAQLRDDGRLVVYSFYREPIWSS